MAVTKLTKLYNEIVSNFYERLIEQCLIDEYKFSPRDDRADIDTVEGLFKDFMIKNNIPRKDKVLFDRIKKEIKDDLKPFLDEDPDLDIVGFATFRAKFYKENFYEIIDYIVQEQCDMDFIIIEEYEEELPPLLQAFEFFHRMINSVESQYELLYVKFDKGKFQIINKDKKDITKEFLSSPGTEAVSFTNTGIDDLMSALIITAPKRIVLITPEKYIDEYSIDILKEIFEDRLEIRKKL